MWGLFDVAARLRAGDGPIAALVGGASCSIGSALQHRVHLMTTKIISRYRLLTSTEERKYDGAVQYFHSCSSPLLLYTVNLHWLHYAPPVTTRVTAVASPKSHNLIHHRHRRNPTTGYILRAHSVRQNRAIKLQV